jgi:hypothetical protein
MVNQEQVGPLLGRHLHSGCAQIDGRGDPRHLTPIGDLEAVQRLRSIAYIGNGEIGVTVADEILEVHAGVT